MLKLSLYSMFLLFVFELSFGETNSIYDTDSRKLMCNVTDLDYKQLSRSICLIVHESAVWELWGTPIGGNAVPYPKDGVKLRLFGRLQNSIFENFSPGNTVPVSKSIKFYDEFIANRGDGFLYGAGTGVIIGDQQILTVDHIFEDEFGNDVDPSEFVAIFGWTETIRDGGETSSTTHFDPYYYFGLTGYDKYGGKELKEIQIKGSQDRLDLSIVKTDRVLAKDIVALNIYTGTDVKKELEGKELYTIGHGLLLPQIISDAAISNANITYEKAKLLAYDLTKYRSKKVLTESQYNRLVFANFDGFKGNSGSPVFVKDSKLGWTVVGIYRGGMNDFKISDKTNEIVEDLYTDEDFKIGKSSEHFQTLQDVVFNRHCLSNCDYINLVKTTPPPPPPPPSRGERICVTLPVGLTPGGWLIHFRNPVYSTYTVAEIYDRYGKPGSKEACCFIPNGLQYDVKMFCIESETAISLNKKGTARAATLRKAAIEHDLASTGVDINTISFVPNVQSGDIPLYVTFDPVIPQNQFVEKFYWDFGDGSSSDQMYPTHKYLSPGLFTVKMKAQINGIEYSYTDDDCIQVGNIVTSLPNQGQISAEKSLGIMNLNTGNQKVSVSIKAKGGITIYPETYFGNGSEIKLSN